MRVLLVRRSDGYRRAFPNAAAAAAFLDHHPRGLWDARVIEAIPGQCGPSDNSSSPNRVPSPDRRVEHSVALAAVGGSGLPGKGRTAPAVSGPPLDAA